MKTYILRLELHDDITSAQDKMNWAKAERILLVWPERGAVLNRRLDLALLQRHSLMLGAQMAVVSRDREVRYFAPRLGIPIFKSLSQAQRSHWRVPRRFHRVARQETAVRHRPPPPEPPRVLLRPIARLAFFSLGVLAVLSIAAILLPGAHLTLTPMTQAQELNMQVEASETTHAVRLDGSVPAHRLRVVVEGRDSLPASGSLQTPVHTATGHVRFTNLTEGPLAIPQGTVVVGRGAGGQTIFFTTTGPGTIPAGPGAQLTLPLRAVQPGVRSNLPAHSLVSIEGPLAISLAVDNPNPIQRGADQQVPLPTQADRETLQARLQEALRETAVQEMEAGLAAGDVLLPPSFTLLEVVEESYQPADAQPADQLELNLRLAFEALVVKQQDLQTLAASVLDANLPPGFAPLDAPLEIHRLTQIVPTESGALRWKMSARRSLQARIIESQVIRLAQGLAPAEAAARLSASLSLQAAPRITLTPSWWPRLPFLPFRIQISASE